MKGVTPRQLSLPAGSDDVSVVGRRAGGQWLRHDLPSDSITTVFLVSDANLIARALTMREQMGKNCVMTSRRDAEDVNQGVSVASKRRDLAKTQTVRTRFCHRVCH
jgi:hypothetical protein